MMDLSLPLGPTPDSLAQDPVIVSRPAHHATPLVFASAHSGRNYPPAFLDSARLDPINLRRSEDSFVDELFAPVVALGIPLLAATFPRAYCDPNREAWELDPAMFEDDLPSWVNTTSPRVGAGLGTLARVVATGEGIYRGKLPFREAEFRVESCWKPYHQALSGLLHDTRRTFGACLLIDCHSMPANTGRGPPPDIVLGDAHGTACAPVITRWAEQQLSALGFAVRRNDPYAGGYVTRHYGRPREGIHALQIEIARSLYMDERRLLRTSGFDRLKARLDIFATNLASIAPRLLSP